MSIDNKAPSGNCDANCGNPAKHWHGVMTAHCGNDHCRKKLDKEHEAEMARIENDIAFENSMAEEFGDDWDK